MFRMIFVISCFFVFFFTSSIFAENKYLPKGYNKDVKSGYDVKEKSQLSFKKSSELVKLGHIFVKIREDNKDVGIEINKKLPSGGILSYYFYDSSGSTITCFLKGKTGNMFQLVIQTYILKFPNVTKMVVYKKGTGVSVKTFYKKDNKSSVTVEDKAEIIYTDFSDFSSKEKKKLYNLGNFCLMAIKSDNEIPKELKLQENF